MEDTARTFVALAADQIKDGKQWIEVLPTADKVRNGPWYMTIERSDLEVWADFIRQNPDRVPVDYNHAGDKQDGSTVAAGWFTGQADVRDTADGLRLYAEVEWTPQAQDEIRSRRYRFISAVMSFANKDPKTGLLTKAKEIIAATLTNRPFFRQLAPVARDLFDSDDLDAVTADFGEDAVTLALAGLAGDEEQRAAAQRVLAAVWTTAYINDLPDSAFLHVESGGKKDSDGKTTPRSLRHFPVKDDSGKVDMPHLRNALSRIPQSNLPANVKQRCTRKAQQMMKSAGPSSASSERNQMDTTVLAKSLGLAEDADETAISEAIKARDTELADVKAKLAEAEAKVLPEDEVKSLVAQAAEGAQAKKELDEMKVESLLSQAVRDGKILPAQKDAYTTMARADFDGVKALIDATPDKALAHLAETGSGGEGADGDGDEKAVKAAKTALTYRSAETGELTADDESLKLHVAAEKILTDEGKPRGKYTAADYQDAAVRAAADLGN